MKKAYWQFTRPLLIVFVIVNCLLVGFRARMESKGLNVDVIIFGNLILLVVSMLNIWFQLKSLRNPNSAAVIRGLMAGTFIKLFVLAAAAMIYLVAAGAGRSVNSIFVAMGLYIVYTWLEVRISLRMNPKK